MLRQLERLETAEEPPHAVDYQTGQASRYYLFVT